MTSRQTHNSPQKSRRGHHPPAADGLGAAITRRSVIRRRRSAMASLEAVMVTTFTLPFMITVLMFTVRATRFVYKMMSHLIGWPYL